MTPNLFLLYLLFPLVSLKFFLIETEDNGGGNTVDRGRHHAKHAPRINAGSFTEEYVVDYPEDNPRRFTEDNPKDNKGKSYDYTDSSPDHSDSSPAHSDSSPDHTDSSSDHTEIKPDHSDSSPDHSGSSPDHSDSSPDHTDSSPDHTDSSPDHSDSSPDHTDSSPDHSDSSPDHSYSSPDHTDSSQDDDDDSSPDFTDEQSDEVEAIGLDYSDLPDLEQYEAGKKFGCSFTPEKFEVFKNACSICGFNTGLSITTQELPSINVYCGSFQKKKDNNFDEGCTEKPEFKIKNVVSYEGKTKKEDKSPEELKECLSAVKGISAEWAKLR